MNLPWTSPEWLAHAEAWIDGVLEGLGRPRTGPVEQPHVRPWATALRVPTEGGPVWLKASIPALGHEVVVVEAIVRRRPDLHPRVLAVNELARWLLMDDAGPRLRELLGPDPRDVVSRWETLLPQYAQLQLQLVPYRDSLSAMGVPDRRIHVLPRLYDELVFDEAALRPDHPDALTDDEIERLRSLAPRVRDITRRLLAHGIPETIQHDDLHDGQIFVRDGRYEFLDWGDSCIAHPFITLTVTLNSVANRLGVGRDAPEVVRVRDAYVDAWPLRRDPAEALVLADALGHISRALSWRQVVRAIPPALAGPYVDGTPGWLRAFLALDP